VVIAIGSVDRLVGSMTPRLAAGGRCGRMLHLHMSIPIDLVEESFFAFLVVALPELNVGQPGMHPKFKNVFEYHSTLVALERIEGIEKDGWGAMSHGWIE